MSSIQAFTTSTVYTTNIYTITKCPATVTNCPIGKVTTDVISLYTTICPLKATPTSQPALEYTTSTVYSTKIYTITKCPASVTNCPIGSVTTDVISLYTTICPIEATPTSHPAPEYTTSTVYSTKIYTITKCPASVTNCPIGSLTTDFVSLYTTICPVTINTAVISPAYGTPPAPASTPLSAASLPSLETFSTEKAVVSSGPVMSASVASGEKSAVSTSTSVTSIGVASASGISKPSIGYTGPTSNSGARNWEMGMGLVLVMAVNILIL
ncbi:hypothetical protein EG329_005881 [Mollisiaceae sp. DMI_Dod_QoI]|nr:hypothetical protein EG329_005881 [Helotiales sp. DMI_Dod_QoI]